MLDCSLLGEEVPVYVLRRQVFPYSLPDVVAERGTLGRHRILFKCDSLCPIERGHFRPLNEMPIGEHVRHGRKAMSIVGYGAAALIGISLGLIGGGGSILTVPLLVYLFSIPASLATAYSLFVVGVTSGIGAILRAYQGQVDRRTALLFAPPAILSIYLTRCVLMPLLPEHLFRIGNLDLTRDRALLVLLALLMLGTASAMIRGGPTAPQNAISESSRLPYLRVAANGILVGILSGLVGAGGGFLILPALVLLLRIPLSQAVGTSLLIIALNSSFGFLGDLQARTPFAWPLLLSISAIATLGIFAGTYLSRFVSNARLKPAFGWFLVSMGVYLLGRELGVG